MSLATEIQFEIIENFCQKFYSLTDKIIIASYLFVHFPNILTNCLNDHIELFFFFKCINFKYK